MGFRKGNENPNWKGGKIQLNCEVCNIKFMRTRAAIKNHVFCSKKCSGIYHSGDNNIGKRPNERMKRSIRMLGDKNPSKKLEVREKISIAMSGDKNPNYGRTGSKHPMYNKSPVHARGDWFIVSNDIKIWMRSSYEIRFATILKKLGIHWSYEPKRFILHKINGTYAPDFYLEGCHMFIEIKGYMRANDQLKIDAFQTEYNDENLAIFYKEDIEKLERGRIIN